MDQIDAGRRPGDFMPDLFDDVAIEITGSRHDPEGSDGPLAGIF